MKKYCSRNLFHSLQFSSVQSLSHIWLFATPWTAARQASLSITNSQSLLKLMSIELVMPSNHLIFCRPLLLPPSIFPSIGVFSNESALRIRWPKYCSFSFNISPSRTSDWFQIGKGVCQGCLLSICLFNLYSEYILQNAGLDEAQAGIKIAGRNINNLRYTDDIPPLWQKVKRN